MNYLYKQSILPGVRSKFFVVGFKRFNDSGYPELVVALSTIKSSCSKYNKMNSRLIQYRYSVEALTELNLFLAALKIRLRAEIILEVSFAV